MGEWDRGVRQNRLYSAGGHRMIATIVYIRHLEVCACNPRSRAVQYRVVVHVYENS